MTEMTNQPNAGETLQLSMDLLRDTLEIFPEHEVKPWAWTVAKGAALIAFGFAWMAVTDRLGRLVGAQR